MASFEEVGKRITVLTEKTKELNEALLIAKKALEEVNKLKKEIKEL